MKQGETILSALRSLGSNPVRSLLTSFGVMVGVTAVVALVGIVTGIGGFVQQQFEEMLDSRVFEITRMSPGFSDFESMNKARSWPVLDSENAEELSGIMTTAEAVAWSGRTSGSVSFGGKTASEVMLRGLSASTLEVSPLDVASGRFFTQAENDASARVCILGSGVAEALDLSGDDLGSSVFLDGHRFYLIGIEEASGSSFGMSLDERISIPFSTFESLFSRPGSEVRITVLPKSDISLTRCQEEARQILRRLRGLSVDEEDNFFFVTQEGAMSSISDALSAVASITIGIAAISLLVGGIGIMNITLVSVTERTREIGTRRALGATRMDIVGQFLVEAVTISVLGGLTGLLTGVGIIAAASSLTPLPATVTGWSVAVALVFSATVGLVFGVFPAWKAAGMSPVEALRYE